MAIAVGKSSGEEAAYIGVCLRGEAEFRSPVFEGIGRLTSYNSLSCLILF